MARPRNPNRDKVKQAWIDSGGTMGMKELSKMAGVSDSGIRKWRKEDKWVDALDEQNSKRNRGGQKGNKNALGHGAPPRNKNAITHGAYSTVHLDDLSSDDRAYIESITLNSEENMLRELQLLIAKENDLKRKINKLEQEEDGSLHVDRVVEMIVPKAKKEEGSTDIEELKMAMQTVVKASAFERIMKLEAELNKTHGRIIKLIDSIKSYELDNRRIELEEKKYNLSKQKAIGVYKIDPENGEIDDSDDDEDESL